MDFAALNESGSVTVNLDGESLFEFHYSNDFYGSGAFSARVVESRNQALHLELADLCWRHYALRRGGMEGLAKSAKTFFTRQLRGFQNPAQLRGKLTKVEEPKGGRMPVFDLMRWALPD